MIDKPTKKFINFLVKNFPDFDHVAQNCLTGNIKQRVIVYQNLEGGFTVLPENSLSISQRLEFSEIMMEPGDTKIVH